MATFQPGPTTEIAIEVRGSVAVVTLTRPKRRNAITVAMVTEFGGALERIEADRTISAVVVTGEGDAFCAGADLGHLARASDEPDAAAESLRAIYRLFLRLHACPLPTVAAVNGPAVGAGMNLALVCDVRVAGGSARFVTRFLDLGLHPGGGHTWMLARAVGEQAAMAAVLLGEELDGEQAARCGLVWRCVADDDMLDVAVGLAGRAGDAPRDVLLKTKESLRGAARIADYAGAVEHELHRQLWSAQQPDFPERLARMTVRR